MNAYPPVSVGQTDFPLRADPLERGPVGRLGTPGTYPMRLLDGPPYANGLPHLGHVLNKHLKDAVARGLESLGNQVEWRPGWDCHGLPLELAVEAQGHSRADRMAFVGAARRYAQAQVESQREVFQAQGWMTQWNAPWRTMDPAFEGGTMRVLADLLERGLLEVRHTAVPWCSHCQSTLASAEQFEQPVEHDTWVVPFDLGEGQWLLSWTTTPWTLPLHQGLVVNPEATYVGLEQGGHTFWVSQTTAARWAAALGMEVGARQQAGRTLMGRGYRSPWTEGRVVGSESVAEAGGTGVLHAVAGLAVLDTTLGHTFGWEVRDVLGADGCVRNSPCDAQNTRRTGDRQALDAVKSAYEQWPGWTQVPMTLDTPHCWRHKKPLLTRASRQVFLRLTQDMRDTVEHWVRTMAFTPETGRARLLDAVSGRPDWCLSRQRTWGVPLALYLDKTTGHPHARAAEWMRQAAEAVATEGVEAWWRSPDTRWGVTGDAERVDDVLDVWFDSGCVPALVGRSEVVVEGVDQFRGWFQSCLWVAAALGWNEPPFKRVVAHGFVVDEQGRKFAKSDGGDRMAKGVPDWKALPTDVVRAWALSGSEGTEKAWSAGTVQAAQATLARWRGVLRFLLANRLEHDGTGTPEAWDRWWWWRCQETAQEVVEACARGETGAAMTQAANLGEQFSALVLTSWKDRLYCAPATTAERQRLDVALRGCASAWMRMLGVLAPRLAAEAEKAGGWSDPGAAEKPTPQEDAEVQAVLRMRDTLALDAEALARAKLGPGRREVAWSEAPAWQGSLVADALDVARVVPGSGVVRECPDPVCPRCRRAQPEWTGACCKTCQARTCGHARDTMVPCP